MNEYSAMLCSSGFMTLGYPRVSCSLLHFAAPYTLNSLPDHLLDVYSFFKSLLKNHLFLEGFGTTLVPFPYSN